MKVLIWIGCCALPTIITWTFDDFGIKLGGALLEVGAIWLAIHLCKKWDWHQAEKKAAEAGMTVSEYGRHGLSEKFLAKLEELSKTVLYDQLKSELKACVKKGIITKEQYTILLNEYSKQGVKR
jgi:hypothetical protein